MDAARPGEDVVSELADVRVEGHLALPVRDDRLAMALLDLAAVVALGHPDGPVAELVGGLHLLEEASVHRRLVGHVPVDRRLGDAAEDVELHVVRARGAASA